MKKNNPKRTLQHFAKFTPEATISLLFFFRRSVIRPTDFFRCIEKCYSQATNRPR